MIGMPALAPVCALAGTPASTSAAAVASATARDAGLTGRALLGGFSTIMWDSGGPSVGEPNYGRNRVRSTQGGRISRAPAEQVETRRMRQHRGGIAKANSGT